MSEHADRPKCPWFRTRLSLVTIPGIAAMVGVVRAEPSWETCLALSILAVVLCTSTLIASLNTVGRARSFWIGTAVSVWFAGAITILASNSFVHDMTWNDFASDAGLVKNLQHFTLVLWSLAPVNGVIALFLYSLFWSRPARDQPPARHHRLQFSLRALFIVITLFLLLFGWNIERARKRGRAVNAIVAAGNIVGYHEPIGHDGVDFWQDVLRKSVDVRICNGPLNPEIGQQLVAAAPIRRLELDFYVNDQDLEHLLGLNDGCQVTMPFTTSHVSPVGLGNLKRLKPKITVEVVPVMVPRTRATAP